MVNRYYIFKDCTQIGSTETRDEAIDIIRQRQKRETHYLLKSAIHGFKSLPIAARSVLARSAR